MVGIMGAERGRRLVRKVKNLAVMCDVELRTIFGKGLLRQVSVSRQDEEIRTLAGDLCLYYHERCDGQGYPYGTTVYGVAAPFYDENLILLW